MQRHLRLRHKADFAHLRAHGQVWRHPLVMVSVAPNDRSHNRYGFITSKQLGTAVVRNRVRRVLREAVRLAHPQLVQGYDVALIARKPIAGQSFQVVCQAVQHCLNKAGLWVSPPGEHPS